MPEPSNTRLRRYSRPAHSTHRGRCKLTFGQKKYFICSRGKDTEFVLHQELSNPWRVHHRFCALAYPKHLSNYHHTMSSTPNPKLVRSREFWAKLRRRQAERAALDSIFNTGGFNAQSIITFVPGSTTPSHSVMLSTGKVLPISSQPESSSIERSAHAARPQPHPKPRRPLTRSGKTWEQEDAEMLARLQASKAKREAKENLAARRKASKSPLSLSVTRERQRKKIIRMRPTTNYATDLATAVGVSPTADGMSDTVSPHPPDPAHAEKGGTSAGPHPQPNGEETAAVITSSRPHPPLSQADVPPETVAVSAVTSGSFHAEEEEAEISSTGFSDIRDKLETYAN
ncbi:hypothetical protein B0H16DRAFT_1465655 [Mycena metata]|uniref:Uncharacterized protein n=1 Tax=Mycena metata TaxID=1033252 RepID=A0AAD7MZ47_9AGAR|nr:hypothetical protein B0H16DRAFT_1465655 [Mycena metata]